MQIAFDLGSRKKLNLFSESFESILRTLFQVQRFQVHVLDITSKSKLDKTGFLTGWMLTTYMIGIWNLYAHDYKEI